VSQYEVGEDIVANLHLQRRIMCVESWV